MEIISARLFICLSVFLAVVCQSVCPTVCQSVHMSLSVCVYLCQSVCLFIYFVCIVSALCMHVTPSVCTCAWVPVCQSVCKYILVCNCLTSSSFTFIVVIGHCSGWTQTQIPILKNTMHRKLKLVIIDCTCERKITQNTKRCIDFTSPFVITLAT